MAGGGGDSLVHEWDVAVSRGTSGLDALEGSLGGEVVPVLGINVGLDDAVVVRAHVALDVSSNGEIWGSHVGWSDTNDVDKGLLETLHLSLDLGGGVRAHVWMRPGVGTDLVARVEGLLEGGSAVVDAAVESTGDEESSLGSGSVEGVDELVHVGTWSIIEGQGNDTWLGA